jgi:protein-tyrosine phosphatase
MTESYFRQIDFESIHNFRDLGGYGTSGGNTVAWRRLFRSAHLHEMTKRDMDKLRGDLSISSVIDLRSPIETRDQKLGLLTAANVRYHNIPLISDGGNKQANEQRYRGLTDMGGLYVNLTRQKEFGLRILEALEIIAEPKNLPLVFHCSAGKDRTGILAAVVLGILEVANEDIIYDFCLSERYMEFLLGRMQKDARLAEDALSLPDYFWKAAPESIVLFLNAIIKEYGSVQGYINAQGADSSLISRIRSSLLE